MKRLLCILVGLTFLIFAACGKDTYNYGKIAEEYVKSQGYNITAQKGEIQKYILEKSKLYGKTESMFYQQTWGVQNIEPDKYFGKEIVVYGFTVDGHPLEKNYKESKGTNIYIMMSEGKVIGGFSNTNPEVIGGFYSLDGKTLEEVTGQTFGQWSGNWKKKYEN